MSPSPMLMPCYAFCAYGVEVELCASTPKLLAKAMVALPPEHSPIARSPASCSASYEVVADASTYKLRRNRRHILSANRIEPILHRLESDLVVHLAQGAPDRLFVHAGVVAIGDTAILLPGRSMAGKSTLVACLVAAGATYFSDEYALIDSHGQVHPYPRPITLRAPRAQNPDAGRVAARTRMARSMNVAKDVATGLPVGLVLFCRYRPMPMPTPRPSREDEREKKTRRGLRPLGPGRTVLGLLKHTLAARTRTKEAFSWLAKVAQAGAAFYGCRGEAGPFAQALVANRMAIPLAQPTGWLNLYL